MTGLTDRDSLTEHQYRDASNLEARIRLHRDFSTNPYPFHRWYFDRLDLPATAHVLEVGAGSGALWRENADRIPPGWELTLTDLSPGILADARRSLTGLHARFAVADAQALPFSDASFDAVLANHMLYHVPDRRRAIAEFRRVLQPGGRLYAATNGEGHLQELRDLLAEYVTDMPMRGGWDFGLDDGAAQLRASFRDVVLYRYDDAFRITQAEPLKAYIRSMGDYWHIPETRRAELDRRIEDLVARGPFHIGKEAGMFVAW
ncbi:MAG TPA: class I SAM-dependent methyltransferase [Chloroflexota bacterium]|nr:class I SAM-dependent methyltransferase [Chloroflexota bacterium]